jgi:hypothetical protein
VLQLVILTSIALLFSSFSTPVLSAVFSLALFVIGSFDRDLHTFAAMAHGATRALATAVAYIIPNFASLNFISAASHGVNVASHVLLMNTAYAALYCLSALAGATLIFERRNLK